MKAREVLLAWEPKRGLPNEPPHAGTIKAGPLIREGVEDWTAPFSMTGGAAFSEWQRYRGMALYTKILADFHSIVVGDGVDPQAAHKAFLAIDEYRKIIARDIPGADQE